MKQRSKASNWITDHKQSRGTFRTLSDINDGLVCENSQQLKVVKSLINYVNYSCKALHLRFLTESEYASLICYSLFGRIEDANKIDSVAM